MTPFKQAIVMIETTVNPISAERVPLEKSLLRVLATGVYMDTDMPPFNKAAMDGFACRKADLGHSGKLTALQLPIEHPYTQKKKDTLYFVPVDLSEKGTALPLEFHGSAHIHALYMLNAIDYYG
jgi:hypothetical protein